MTTLEKLRRELSPRVTQEAMARAVGCSLQHYHRVERGLATPDPLLCVRLVDALIERGARLRRDLFLRYFHPKVWEAVARVVRARKASRRPSSAPSTAQAKAA